MAEQQHKTPPPRSAEVGDGEVEREVRIEQDLESPEGAPPARAVERRLWAVFAICAVVGVIVVGIVLWQMGGPTAIAVGVAMLIAYGVYGGATAILAVRERVKERREIEARVERQRSEGEGSRTGA